MAVAGRDDRDRAVRVVQDGVLDRADAGALTLGMGVPADPVEAAKWHFVAKSRGESDPWLDDFVAKLTPDQRTAAEKAAKPWLPATRPHS